ncbi:MAG: cupin domain-containing protein [Candidatus Methylomirabilales bacterium]
MGFYRWATMVPELVTPDYSTAAGGTIRGEKIEVGYDRHPPRTGAKPHAHPNEQMICVLEGRLRCRLGAEWRVLGPGGVMHIPSMAEHEVTALDQEVRVFFCKDVVAG